MLIPDFDCGSTGVSVEARVDWIHSGSALLLNLFGACEPSASSYAFVLYLSNEEFLSHKSAEEGGSGLDCDRSVSPCLKGQDT